MIVLFFRWWYTDGWRSAFRAITAKSSVVLADFSVPILLRTLFEPWKQIRSYAAPGSAINGKMQALMDNTFARTFGFIIRSNIIFYASIIAAFVAIANGVIALLWPVIPLLPLVFLIVGVASYA